MSEYEGITMGDILSMRDNEIKHLKTEKTFETGFMDPTIGRGLDVNDTCRKPYKLVGQQCGAKTTSELQTEIENKLTVSEYRTLAKTTFNSKKEKIIEFTGIINKLVDEGLFDDFSDENTTETNKKPTETNKKPTEANKRPSYVKNKKLNKTDMYVSLKFETIPLSIHAALSSIASSLNTLLESVAHDWKFNCLPTFVVSSCSTEVAINIFPNRMFDGTRLTELLKITHALIHVALDKIVNDNNYGCKIFITSNINYSSLTDLVFPGIDTVKPFDPSNIEVVDLITSVLITYMKYGM